METKYYLRKGERVAPNKPVRIYERNNEGLLVGSYDAYYDFKGNYYTLYPKYNPNVWQLKRNVKHKVSALLVQRED